MNNRYNGKTSNISKKFVKDRAISVHNSHLISQKAVAAIIAAIAVRELLYTAVRWKAPSLEGMTGN